MAVLAAALLAASAAPARAADAAEAARYWPADANVVVIVQMDQLLASDGFKKLRKEVPMIGEEFEGHFRKEFGFEIGNVERMSMGVQVKDGRPVGIFQLKSAVKAETVVKAASAPRFNGDKETTFKEEKVGTMTMYVPDKDYREAICFVNDKTMVYGRVKELKAVLEANKKPVLSDGLQAALKSADPKATVTVAMDVKTVLSAEKPPTVPGVDFKAITDNVNGGSLTIQESGTDVLFRGIGVCKDDKGAEVAKNQAEALRKFVIEQMKMAPPGVPKGVLDLPGRVKIGTKGNLCEATLTVKVDDAIALIKTMLLVEPPRPAKPADEKPTKPAVDRPPAAKKP
jgi:hypothetical protein